MEHIDGAIIIILSEHVLVYELKAAYAEFSLGKSNARRRKKTHTPTSVRSFGLAT